MANLFGLSDLEWALLANDSYRRYEFRGEPDNNLAPPEFGYDPSTTQEINFRRYPKIDSENMLSGWIEFRHPETLAVLNLETDIFKPLRDDPSNKTIGFLNKYDYSGDTVDAFSARVYKNPSTNEIIVSFRGSESFEEMFGALIGEGESDARNDWVGEFADSIKLELGELAVAALFGPNALKLKLINTITNIDSKLGGNIGVVLLDNIHEQVNAAYYFTQQLKTILDSDPSLQNYKLAFTGHSLGAYLATAISAIETVQGTDHLPAGGQNAVAFNPFSAFDSVAKIFTAGAEKVTDGLTTSDELPPIEAIGTLPTQDNVRIIYNEFDMARRGNLWNTGTQKAEAWGVEAMPLADYNPAALNPAGYTNVSTIDPFDDGALADQIAGTLGDHAGLITSLYNLFSDNDATPEQFNEFQIFSRRAHSIDNQLLTLASAKNDTDQDTGIYELTDLVSQVPTFFLAMGTKASELESEDLNNPFLNGFIIESLQLELVKDRLENGYDGSMLKQMIESLKFIAGANLIAPVTHVDRQGYYKIQESLSEILIENIKINIDAGVNISAFSLSADGQYFTVDVSDINYLGENRILSELEEGSLHFEENIYEDFQRLIGHDHQSYNNYYFALRDPNEKSLENPDIDKPYDTNIQTNIHRDLVITFEGNDTIIDALGDDSYFAGKGDDIIKGSYGNDFIHGGFGYDSSLQSEFGSNFDFDGFDTVDYTDLVEATLNVTPKNYSYTDPALDDSLIFPYYSITILDTFTDLPLGNDYLVSIENIIGSNLSDNFLGGDGDDIFNGGGGDDVLNGGLGNDSYQFTGEFGKDTILDDDGIIEIDGIKLNGTAVLTSTSNKYLLEQNGKYFVMSRVDDNGVMDEAGKHLRIAVNDGSDTPANSITVKDYNPISTNPATDTAFGITLGASLASSNEFIVNSFAIYDNGLSLVSSLADGGFVVTWGSLDRSEVYGQRYSANGAPNGPEFQVNSFTNFNIERNFVSSLDDGGFIVTWDGFDEHANTSDIYGQRYSANGAPNGSEFQINSFTDERQTDPSVTSLNDGGFVVTWDSWGQDGNGYGIYGQRYSANGAPNGSEFQVNSFTDNYQSNPSVTSLNDGGFVVTWESWGQDGSGNGIYGQRYSANGAPNGSEFQVNSFTDSYQSNSSVTSLNDGGFVVTWESWGQDGSGSGIYGQRYSTNGAPNGPEFQVNSFTDEHQNNPSVSSLNDGRFVVTWFDDNRGENGEGDYDVVAKIFDSSTLTLPNFGTSGADNLVGNNDGTTFVGGPGNDQIAGGTGNDTYAFSPGDGFDTITDKSGSDTLKIGGGLTPANLTFSQVGRNLVIDIASGVTIVDQFSGNPDTIVEFASFDDGTVIELPSATNKVTGTAGRDILNGTPANDVISSLGGSIDRMSGGEGADIFVIGAEAVNGVRERDIISDFEVGIDSILLEDGATVGSIRQSSSGVTVFLEGDLDAIYVQGDGVLVGNLTFVPEDIVI